MAQIIEEIRLIMSELEDNHNKWWTGELFDNGDVRTRWGRVGMGEQSKMFPGQGKRFLDKKKGEKIKKGYSELKTVSSGGGAKVQHVQQGDLFNIATKQIKTSSPALNTVIKNLVDWNIHQITSNTNVTYNSNSGLFETPLGIVTPDGVKEARAILSECVDFVKHADYGVGLTKHINNYLRLVPQNIGMRRLEPKSFFPDIKAIQAQNDILDSLEASYKALQAPVKDDSAAQDVLEQVFRVRFDSVNDGNEVERVKEKYAKSRKDVHVCAHLKVKNVYEIEIEENAKAFETGKQVGEIMELWHGTKKANVLSILKSGLQVSPPSTATIAGKMFGNGVYFAIDSTKSLNYSYGYWDGKTESQCFMFVADVALGKYYVPKGRSENLPKAGYDSTWAKSGVSGIMNDEIVVYQNDRFRLKYLVEFA